MASLTDIFTPSFFIFLGILILVAALIVVFFESRMREQNHKIASMLNLVTCLADEINVIKIHQLTQSGVPNQMNNTNLNEIQSACPPVVPKIKSCIHAREDLIIGTGQVTVCDLTPRSAMERPVVNRWEPIVDH